MAETVNMEQLLEYALTKRGAYLDFPFGPEPVCVKVCGHVVFQGYRSPQRHMVTLKCRLGDGAYWRARFESAVVPGYHCPRTQRPYFITVHLNGSVSCDALYAMVDQAYDAVVAKLTRAERARLDG